MKMGGDKMNRILEYSLMAELIAVNYFNIKHNILVMEFPNLLVRGFVWA